MSNYVRRLREQHANTWQRAKTLLDTADRANRDLTPNEQREYDSLTADLDGLARQVTDLEAAERRHSEAQEAFDTLLSGPVESRAARDQSGLAAAIRQRIEDRDQRPLTFDLRGLASGVEARDLSTGSGAGVGVRYANEIVRGLVTGSGILAAGARLVTTDSGEPYKVPTGSNGVAGIVAEGAAIGESDPTLSVVTLGAYKYGVLIDVTFEMIRDSSFDVAAYIAEQAGEAIGTAFGAHLATGDGSSKPTGVASSALTGKTGGTGVTGAFTSDDLIDLQHSVAAPYQRRASWVMRSATLGAVRKLKDAQGQYLFTSDVLPNDPQAVGLLLGRPVYLDEAVAAVGLGAKSVLYGDFTRVWVRQAADLRFESSADYRFGNDMVSFRALHRLDGALVDLSGAVKAFTGGAS